MNILKLKNAGEKKRISTFAAFYFPWSLGQLDVPSYHGWGWDPECVCVIYLLSLLIQILIFSGNISTEMSRMLFNTFEFLLLYSE